MTFCDMKCLLQNLQNRNNKRIIAKNSYILNENIEKIDNEIITLRQKNRQVLLYDRNIEKYDANCYKFGD